MTLYDATEQAYVNGYQSGYSAGRRSLGRITCDVMVEGDIPTRAHENDAGLDLYAREGGWILPKCRKTFGTGVHIAIPKGAVGFLTSKSGLMSEGITSRGTIDCDYTGEVRAILYNQSWLPKRIRKGQKITQLVIVPIIIPGLRIVSEMEDTERGDGGFGSTGKF